MNHAAANPFSQPSSLWQLTAELGKADVPAFEQAFEDMALSVASFELDEASQRWRATIIGEGRPPKDEASRRLAILKSLQGIAPSEWSIEPVPPRDWIADLQRQFPPQRIGRFWVYGSHIEQAAPVASLSIEVEAGAAFGSGEHETTRGCLLNMQWLARRETPQAILDMGCGTAILAVGAARLWPGATLLAGDIDKMSVKIAAETVRNNRAHRQVSARWLNGFQSPLPRYDLIIANILARPLKLMAPQLVAHTRRGGHIILAGLLKHQRNDVLQSYRQQGARLVRQERVGDWPSLLLKRD